MSMHVAKASVLLLVYIALFVMATLLIRAQAIPDRPGGARPVPPKAPRLAPLPEAQWTDVQRKLVATFSRDGQPDNALRTLLHVPEMVEAVMPFTAYLSRESSLSPRHRELLILRVAWLCANQSLWATHAPLAQKVPLTADEIRRIAQGPDAPGWDAFEATLLRMADQLYRNSSVDDATWNALAATYDLYHLMDAVETVNHFTVLAMMYNSFGVQPDEGTTDRLPTQIPYRVVVPPRQAPLKTARVEPAPGTGIAVGRTFGRHPKLAEPRSRRANYINRGSPLSPRHREMLILRIGWNCQSEYEWAQHVGNVGRAREHGLDPVRIAQGPDAPGWDPFEVMILRAADELYRDATVSDRTWDGLSARFDTKMMMSAIFTASSYRATSMALNAFGVQLEPGNERFPQLPSP
jgi:alkylhydroperoxidase family enzyme